ncbi:MAG: preprotein translocase subunit YajC [Alphaproteobacteria bacterium]|nr:preprotein translocase subunit YajC [Alphaproteobacteria bacterium]
MFVSPAYAQAAEADGGGMLVSFLPLILIFVVFYFLLIRPQQKKMKDHKAMLADVGRGDRIVTGGGIIGTVTKISGDSELTVEIAPEIKVKVVRDTVTQIIDKKGAKRVADDDDDDVSDDEKVKS